MQNVRPFLLALSWRLNGAIRLDQLSPIHRYPQRTLSSRIYAYTIYQWRSFICAPRGKRMVPARPPAALRVCAAWRGAARRLFFIGHLAAAMPLALNNRPPAGSYATRA